MASTEHPSCSCLPTVEYESVQSRSTSIEFSAMFWDIVQQIIESQECQDVPEASKWFAKILQYNVPQGKKNRGKCVVVSYKLLQEGRNPSLEDIRLANVLGWCVEMFQTYLLMLDDIMDNSETRRGQPCWFRQKDIGLSGINDAILLQSAMYSVIKKNFGEKPYYKNILELFNETLLKTSLGQFLDTSTAKGNKPDLTKFNMRLYSSIVKYKTAYYTFQLPVSLAMLMSGIVNSEIHRQANSILLELGHFFQIQDDFLDCYGDPLVTGKIGTDIQSGKCSWLAVVALQRVNSKQLRLMEDYYGIDDPSAIEKIKDLYEELGLPNTYAVYEETSYNLIKTQIQQISGTLPHALFYNIMDAIYKRKC